MSATKDMIGRDDKPIRALTFGGGGYSTALQLGVAHALLVHRGRAPDVVAGISAGAVNAVALAEILQAGEGASGAMRVERQVACFRKIYEAYRGSPGAMASALLPDSLQIDTHRPLEPMKLPIHIREERILRDQAAKSRSGLMNVYNKLLELRLPVGTITRVVRRILGIRFACELEPPARRCAARVTECLQLLNLAGLNLHRLAPLGPMLFLAAVRTKATPPEGGTAGELISHSPVWEGIIRGLTNLLSLLVLITLWPLFTVLALLFGGLILLLCGIRLGASRAWQWWRSTQALQSAQVVLFFRNAGRLTFSAAKLLGSLLIYLVLWGVLPWGLVLLLYTMIEKARLCIHIVGLILLLLAVVPLVCCRRRNLFLNILRRNAIASALLDLHPVRELFVRLFDPTYYGKLDMDAVVEAALHDRSEAKTPDRSPKRLNEYADPTKKNPIRVGVVAANVATGKLEAMLETTPVVDALLAAIAAVPLFKPQKIGDQLYVDGVNVANEVTWPVIDLLRRRIPRDPNRPAPGDINSKASSLHIYSVSPLPLSHRELEPDERDVPKFTSGSQVPLVDVVARALKLQRFRDATLERRLTELHTRAMAQGNGICFPHLERETSIPGAAKHYLRAWFYPIEPDRPLAVDRGLLESRTEEDRRKVIAETVASGCRAAMERMLLGTIRRTANGENRVRCSKVIEERLRSLPPEEQLPRINSEGGPGLSEVCRHCKLVDNDKYTYLQTLSARPNEKKFPPDWPSPADKDCEIDSDPQQRLVTEDAEDRKGKTLVSFLAYKMRVEGGRRDTPRWPAPRSLPGSSGAPSEAGTLPVSRPTVSLLFSGGVFRGVFQVGVINALSEVNLRPDIVAGASIGSITGAMVARLFATGNTPETRAKALRGLAATYMAVDRLVLTDRFADFVRTTTVRAAQAELSLRQLDRFTRLYDQPRSGVFSREARRVIAGFERLFYVSPFELRMLLQAMRFRQRHRVVRLLRDYFQEWLERGGVGDEILGAEPLSLLITKHVLEGLPEFNAANPDETPIDQFLRDGIVLLATTTNLTRGRLETLGLEQLGTLGLDPMGPRGKKVSLHQGLLASSAFPGVFRPRWSWEVFPSTADADLLVDGGVMDNLPFDAIAEFLDYAAKVGLIEARPGNGGADPPHLIFSASLRADPEPLDGNQIKRLEDNWPALRARTQQLGYNQKLTLYEEAQRGIRRITRAADVGPSRVDPDLHPLSIEVITIRPKWLCGTFAFHPMLGFKRLHQARSIAHGCASTLWKLGAYAVDPEQLSWLKAWGVTVERLPDLRGMRCEQELRPLISKKAGDEGKCWFNGKYPCPFSSASMKGKGEVSAAEQISRIHTQCGLPETHTRRD